MSENINPNELSPEILTFKDNYLVTKSNTLIMKASYELSTSEQKIVLLLISKIQPTDTFFKKYILKVTDYMQITNNSSKSVYSEMKKAITKLMERLIYINIEGKDEPLICHWISSTQPDKTAGEFEISINNELNDFLLGLFPEKKIVPPNQLINDAKVNKTVNEKIKPYTSYKYSIARKLESKYAYRLYEMLKCNEFKNDGFIISLEEFRTLLSINGNSYETFGNINNKILKICKKEINELTDIKFDVKPIKKIKKVVSLRFTIHSKKNKKN